MQQAFGCWSEGVKAERCSKCKAKKGKADKNMCGAWYQWYILNYFDTYIYIYNYIYGMLVFCSI